MKRVKLLSTILTLVLIGPNIGNIQCAFGGYDPQSQLAEAVEELDVNLARHALTAKADVNLRDSFSNTPLHMLLMLKLRPATRKPQELPHIIQLALVLINNRADVNAQNTSGLTPLHLVASYASPELTQIPRLAKIILDGGANVNARDRSGFTPLQLATNAPAPFVKLLLNRGADYTKDPFGDTLLDNARSAQFDPEKSPQEKANARDVVALLESYEVLAQAQPNSNTLQQAIGQGFTNLVQRILRAGIEPEKAHLELAKTQYIQTQDNNYKEIGRMLLQKLGFTTEQSGISKQGVRPGLALLPEEIIVYIRTFLQ